MSTTIDSAYKLPPSPRSTDVPDSVLPTVFFDDVEVQLAHHVAAARLLSYAGSDANETFGNQDALEAHTTGVLGEMAVRRLLDHPDEEIVHVYGDGGSDVEIQGYSADVKTTSASVFRPDLIVSAEQELRADLYVLCQRLDPGKVRVCGYATQETVKNRKPKRFPSGRQNFVVPPENLRILGWDSD